MPRLYYMLSSAIFLAALSGCATQNPYAVPTAQLKSAEYSEDVAACEKSANETIKTDVQKVVAESVVSSVAVSLFASAIIGGPVYSVGVSEDKEAKRKRHEYVVRCLQEKRSTQSSSVSMDK